MQIVLEPKSGPPIQNRMNQRVSLAMGVLFRTLADLQKGIETRRTEGSHFKEFKPELTEDQILDIFVKETLRIFPDADEASLRRETIVLSQKRKGVDVTLVAPPGHMGLAGGARYGV